MSNSPFTFELSPEWRSANPVQIFFGDGCLTQLPSVLPAGRVLVLTTPGMLARGGVARLQGLIGLTHEVIVETSIGAYPTLDELPRLASRYAGHWSALLALGGGSVIDTAKVLSVLLCLDLDFDFRGHLESGAKLPAVQPIPVVAIPTTAGTGSEVTPFATVWDLRAGKKYSFAGPSVYPRWAFVEPALTYSLPLALTVATGLDAFSQALESIWNRHAQAWTLPVATRAAVLAFGALSQLGSNLPTPAVRTQLMEASLLAGLAISQTRTGLAHAMSYPITARHGLEHGFACSFTLPAVLRFNAQADDGRLIQLARSLGFADCASLAAAIARLLRQLGVPAYVAAKVPDYAALIAYIPEMVTPGRADNNLRTVELADIAGILADTQTQLHAKEEACTLSASFLATPKTAVIDPSYPLVDL